MERHGLNPQEAALLTLLATCPEQERARLLQRLEPTSQGALAPALHAFDVSDQAAQDEAIASWDAQDIAAIDPLRLLESLPEQEAAHQRSHLDARWARVLDMARHHRDPMCPVLPHPATLPIAARQLVEVLGLRAERDELLPQSEAHFDLAHFYDWAPHELLQFASRLGHMLLAHALRQQDRRALARQLHALPAQSRDWIMHDLKHAPPLDDLLQKRVDEVLIGLRKRPQITPESLLTSLGLYLFAVAAGRRLADRALTLAERLPHPFGADLQSFVRQHRTSTRRGLEPLAEQAIETLLELMLDAPEEDPHEPA